MAFVLAILLASFYLIMNPKMLTQSQQVPCLFLFGDSLFDNGNNNLLATQAKANYHPYGIDYPGGPTGRFTNGRNSPDFLAQLLGFNKSIAPFATASGSEILQGVNYASEAAGILDDTGRTLGDRFSLNRQLSNHGITKSRIANLLRDPNNATVYLNKCLYALYIGNDDYANNYLLSQSYPTSRMFTPEQFAKLLVQQYTGQLKTLYNYGARKIAIFGLGRIIGCIPQVTKGSSCVESINDEVDLFNMKLKPLVDDLNSNLPGAKLIYINNTSIYSADPSTLGYRIVNAPCCAVSSSTGFCIPNKVPCSNRDQYFFWDNLHPTEPFNRATATRAYNAMLPSDAYPFDIRRLVQQ